MNDVELFQSYLRECKKIVILVGAGLSVSSGLATQPRGSRALWKNFNTIDLATADAFYIDPGLVWQYHSWLRATALNAKPNKGHIALARLAALSRISLLTITQNVDGLNLRSGHDRSKLAELHGSLFALKCTSFMCNHLEVENYKQPLTLALLEVKEYEPRAKRKLEEDVIIQSPQFTPVKELTTEELPSCPICHELLRPGVSWVGELLPQRLLDKIDTFLESDPMPDLVLVVGTSGTVYPANSYVDRVILKGGKVAVFNTDIDRKVLAGEVAGTWGFKGDAATLLPSILEGYLKELEKTEESASNGQVNMTLT